MRSNKKRAAARKQHTKEKPLDDTRSQSDYSDTTHMSACPIVYNPFLSRSENDLIAGAPIYHYPEVSLIGLVSFESLVTDSSQFRVTSLVSSNENDNYVSVAKPHGTMYETKG
jgi:hypothetical protein